MFAGVVLVDKCMACCLSAVYVCALRLGGWMAKLMDVEMLIVLLVPPVMFVEVLASLVLKAWNS